jgi:Zn-dependent protease with chaperone function
MRLPVFLILLCHLAATGWLIPRVISRAAWVEVRPRMGLRALHTTVAAHLAGMLVLGGLAAHDAVEQAMIWLLHADKSRLHNAYAGDQAIDPAWDLAILLVGALVLSLVISALREARRVRRARRGYLLLCSSRQRPDLDATVIDNDAPAVWCLPLRRDGRIFVTTAALEVLAPDELGAAIEHERAHLGRHHHRMVFAADTIVRVVRTYGALRSYPSVVRHLVELDADDMAVRRTSRRVLAAALLHLGELAAGRSTVAGLAMNETSMSRRIRRLVDESPTRVSRFSTTVVLTAAATAVVIPPALVFLPALVLAGTGH